MPYSLKLVSTTDATLVDFHGTNAADLSGLVVTLRDSDFGLTNPPETERALFEGSSPGGSLAFRRHALIESSFMVNVSATSQANLLAGMGTMAGYLQNAGRNGWALKWTPDGATEARYFDLVDADIPPLFSGNDGEGYFAYTRFEGRDIPISIVRQPYARGPEISSAVNLLREGTYPSENAWTWDSSVGITGWGVGAGSGDSYKFGIATIAVRNRQQSTATGSLVAGDITTFQFQARAESGTGARIRAVVRYLDAAGLVLGTEQVSGQVTLTTAFQTISVTTTAAPATTSKAIVSMRMEDVDATSYGVNVRYFQLAKESTASLFREGSEAVSNNITLAGTVGRMMPIFIQGSAPTPASFSIKGDTGSQIESMMLAKKSSWGLASGGAAGPGRRLLPFAEADHYFYLNDLMYNGTTSVADADAYGGFAAQTSSTGTTFNRRTRTQLGTIAPGTYDLYIRVRSVAACNHTIQLRWGLSDADPVAYAESIVNFDTTGLTAFPYVHLRLGRIIIPLDGSALSVELWSELVSGASSLMMDIATLVPVDEAAAIISVPGASKEMWLGKDLAAPNNPVGLTAGSVSENSMLLTAVNNAAGPKPNTGLTWPVAYHTVTFETVMGSNTTCTFRVRNITDSTDAVAISRTVSLLQSKTYKVRFTSVAGKSYQPQVVLTATPGGNLVTVSSITHIATPFVGLNETISTNADLGTVKKLNSSDIPTQDLTIGGSVPMWLDPGLNAVYFHFNDIPASGYDLGQAVKDRSPVVKVTYKPRYLYS